MKLDNKNIVVTGANRGIGAAIVRELLKYKVGKVYAAARRLESLPDLGDKRVIPLALDITNAKQVADAAQKGIERTMQQMQEMRRQQASQLVVAPGMAGLKEGPRGGGKIQIP